MKKTCKRVLAVVLSLVMVFSVISVGAVAITFMALANTVTIGSDGSTVVNANSVEEAIEIGLTFEKSNHAASGTSGKTLCTEDFYYVTITLNQQVNANGFARATLEGQDMIISVAGGYLTGAAEGSIAKYDTVTFKAQIGCVNSATTASTKEARLFEVQSWEVVPAN